MISVTPYLIFFTYFLSILAQPVYAACLDEKVFEKEFNSPVITHKFKNDRFSAKFEVKSKEGLSDYKYILAGTFERDAELKITGIKETNFTVARAYKENTSIPSFKVGMHGYFSIIEKIQIEMNAKGFSGREVSSVITSLKSEAGMPEQWLLTNVENEPVILSLNKYFNDEYKLEIDESSLDATLLNDEVLSFLDQSQYSGEYTFSSSNESVNQQVAWNGLTKDKGSIIKSTRYTITGISAILRSNTPYNLKQIKLVTQGQSFYLVLFV